MGLLALLVALLCVYAPACGAEGCSSLRHLENGQTFFRYGGLLVIFRCRPGYKLHGYKTNSCVSGHWSRDTPVCVGSGCSNPGPLTDGTSSMNQDGSWTVFSCNGGFRLHGPSLLYCKGHTWNSTKPVCKESDMMSSASGVSVQKPKTQQNLQTAVVLKTHHKFHYDTQVKDGVQITHREAQQGANEARGAGTGRHGSEANALQEEEEKLDENASKSHLSATFSSTLSLVSGTGQSPTAHTPTSPLHHTKSALSVLGAEEVLKFGEPVTTKVDVTPSEAETGSSQTADEDQRAETGFQDPPLSQSESVEKEATTLSTSVYLISPSSSSTSLSLSLPSSSASTSSTPTSTQSNMKAQRPPSDTSTPTEPTSHRIKYHNSTSGPPLLPLSLSRRPVCTYPPLPAHGTFYFRNVENPGPREHRHYIQYACYPGYTLAHGDVRSYCQQGGTWNGTTPVCLEFCSVNNGGCSQLCSHSRHYNQSSNQTQTRAQCLCRAGFTLLDDGRTCQDVDECVEGHHQCQQGCINTFGSFKCSCDDGYQPGHNQTSCTDVDECLLPAAVTGCVFGCVNTPGSFYCQCPTGYSLQTADSHCQDVDECAFNQGLGPCTEQCHNSPGSYRCSCMYGHILAGNGHSCIAECPPGYRKQPTTPPENSTAQILREECVDINECQEETCEWQCVNLPGSHRCICPRGYSLHRDGRRCKDINECSRKNGGCSHLCVNQKGGYKCACPASHRLSPYSWKKCVPRTTVNTAG